MLKIHASISKKVPIPNHEYSSQSFGAGIEIELADGATDEQIQSRIAEVYSSLHEAINAQIIGANAFGGTEEFKPPADDKRKESAPPQQTQASSNNGNVTKNGSAASDKQVGMILGLAKETNVNRADLNGACQRLFNSDLDHLSKLNASSLIGDLQKVRDGKLDGATLFGNRTAKAA